jgi:hypothetical protein
LTQGSDIPARLASSGARAGLVSAAGAEPPAERLGALPIPSSSAAGTSSCSAVPPGRMIVRQRNAALQHDRF